MFHLQRSPRQQLMPLSNHPEKLLRLSDCFNCLSRILIHESLIKNLEGTWDSSSYYHMCWWNLRHKKKGWNRVEWESTWFFHQNIFQCERIFIFMLGTWRIIIENVKFPGWDCIGVGALSPQEKRPHNFPAEFQINIFLKIFTLPVCVCVCLHVVYN